MILWFTVFITSLSLCVSDDCVIKKDTEEKQTEKQLGDFLARCNDYMESPIGNYSMTINPETGESETNIPVKLEVILRSFAFDDNEETMTIYCYTYYSWQDDRLKWNPEDFKGIKSAPVFGYDIWTPELKLVNSVDPADLNPFFAKCRANSTGRVKCVLPEEHHVFCGSTLRNWPYDTKICELKFDYFSMGEAKIIFKLNYIRYFVDSYRGSGWEITRGKVFQNNASEIQHIWKFHLVRTAEGLESSIVAPSFVIALLTVTTILLDYRGNNRLGMLCLSLLSHFIFSMEISMFIPKHGADTPGVLLFISRSTILTVLMFLLIICFRSLGKKKNQPPQWMKSCNDLVLNSYGRYFVVTWDKDEPPREWTRFANIANSVCLLIVIITYICLFASYMPVKTPEMIDFDVFHESA